jgi:hypothetical protein
MAHREEGPNVERTWTDPATGKRHRVGTADDAGRLCVTAEAEHGVSGHQYRRMVRKPPKTSAPPPGPIDVGGALLMDPDTREALYDLDAVRKWNAARPGRGKWRRTTSWPRSARL